MILYMIYILIILCIILLLLNKYEGYINTKPEKTYNIITDVYDLEVGKLNNPELFYSNEYYRVYPSINNPNPNSVDVYIKVPCKTHVKDKYILIAAKDGVKYYDLNCYKMA